MNAGVSTRAVRGEEPPGAGGSVARSDLEPQPVRVVTQRGQTPVMRIDSGRSSLKGHGPLAI